jgi:ubiquinone/menaquinone biosynthesis C-methylase UbiE
LFVQDRFNLEEILRLDIQDKMLTTAMGGVLPELADEVDISDFRRVLDVGCGTGGWLMEMVRAYPTVERLVGADISGKMITYARERASEQQLAERVQFQRMDALQMLEFPNSSFDLVNQRLAASWLRTWEWKKLLLEYQRVTRPDGIIRITDADIIESNSPALMKIQNLFLVAFYRSGSLFKVISGLSLFLQE